MWLGVVLPHGCSPCPSTRPQRPRSHQTLDGGDDEPQHAHAPTRATTTIEDRMARVAGSLEPVPVEWLVRADGFVPKARYTSAAFADLELERLWSRVWQVAAREEELAQPGDFVEYTIGDESVLVVRAGDGTIGAFHNSCRHRGTRLAAGAGAFADGCIQCPYHGWQYDLDGALVRVVDAEEFTNLPDGLAPALGTRRLLRRLRVRQPRPRCEATARVPRSTPDVARAVSPRAHAVALLSHDDHRRELEGSRRRIQRGLPRARSAPADPSVDRRREHRVRTARNPRALRPPARGAPRVAAEPAARSRTRRVRRGRDPRRPRRGVGRRVPRGRARRGRRTARVRAARRPDVARGLPSAPPGVAAGARRRHRVASPRIR